MISSKIQTLAIMVLITVLSIVLMVFGLKSYAVRSSSDVLQNNVIVMIHKSQDGSFRRNAGSFYLDKNAFQTGVSARVASQAKLEMLPNAAEYNRIKQVMQTGTEAQKSELKRKYGHSTLAWMEFDYLKSENGDAKSISGVKVTLYANGTTSVSKNMTPKKYVSRYVISPRADNRDSKDIAQYQKTIIND